MERNQIIGIVLIMATFMLWTITSAPSKEEKEKAQRIQDSIALVQQTPGKSSVATIDSAVNTAASTPVNDSLTTEAGKLKFGAFAPAASGELKEEILENEFIRITFTNKGAKIKEALLKKHYKTVTDSSGKDGKELVKMLAKTKYYGSISTSVNTQNIAQ